MRSHLNILFLLVFFLAGAPRLAGATAPEKRFALVVGNASYEAHRLATPANDAELVARVLRGAGFEVVHARDLKQDALRQVFSEFLEKLRTTERAAIVFVYFAGYGLQSEGENYLLSVDARIAGASDLPRYGLRLSDLMHSLDELRLKASILVLDAARQGPFVLDGGPPAAGLAWLDLGPNTLVAFNAAPGMSSMDAAQGYGPYARALAEMVNEAGFTLPETFVRVRLRVHELTKGAQVPWHSWNFERQPMLVERPAGQSQRAHSLEREAWLRSQTMASLGPQQAYFSALIRDSFDAYTDFLADHGGDPLGKRILAILAVRREAITWRRTCQADSPEAYWTYLERYPGGAHSADARHRLETLSASVGLPAKFRRLEYDIPPPLPNELEYSGRSALSLADAAFLPGPGPGPRDIIGDPPEFVLTSAATPAAANDPPVKIPVPPAAPRIGQRDSFSFDFDATQMRPSIDDRPVKADLLPVRPSSAAPAKAGLIGELENKSGAAAVPRVLAPSIPSQNLPFWTILDPSRRAITVSDARTVSEPAMLPVWTNQSLLPSDRIELPAGERMWTGASADSVPALLAPTRLVLRARKWVMLTREAAIPLPLARPGDLSRRSVPNQARISGAVPPDSTVARQTRSAAPSTSPSRATVPAAVPKQRSSNAPSVSTRSTARAGSPAGTSSAATTSSQ